MGKSDADPIKQWMIVLLTGLYTVLYVMALVGFGWTPNDKVLLAVQPIVYVIIGYFFGRIPGEQNEKRLKDQVDQQTNAAAKAQSDKAAAEGARERKAQQVRDARVALLALADGDRTDTREGGARTVRAVKPASIGDPAARQAVMAALDILETE